MWVYVTMEIEPKGCPAACMPREGGKEGSGQGSYCVRDLALQFPVRYEGSVSTQKGVCTCEGRIWILTASGSFHIGRTPGYIPAPQDGEQQQAHRLLGILPCFERHTCLTVLLTVLSPCFAQVPLSWACLGRDLWAVTRISCLFFSVLAKAWTSLLLTEPQKTAVPC